MRVKIKIKNKLEGKNNSLIEELNWKQKKIKKRTKKSKYRDQIRKKTKHNKFELKDKSENRWNLDKKTEEKKIRN
jgi:hypothetical protein